MKTSYLSLICAGLLLFSFPAFQRAQDQAREPDEAAGVVNSGTLETSGTVAAKAGADVLFAVPLQAGLSLGSEGEQMNANQEIGVPRTDDVALLVLDGDGQSAPAGSFNANPFDIAVWQGSGSTPLAGQLVTFTVEQGNGLLASTTAGPGASALTLASDDDGTVQAYYQQGAMPGVLSSIRVDALGKSLTLESLSSGSATGAAGITPVAGATPVSGLGKVSAPMAMASASLSTTGQDSRRGQVDVC